MDQDDSQSEAQERLIVKTWRAWRTVHEMVHDRVCRFVLYMPLYDPIF